MTFFRLKLWGEGKWNLQRGQTSISHPLPTSARDMYAHTHTLSFWKEHKSFFSYINALLEHFTDQNHEMVVVLLWFLSHFIKMNKYTIKFRQLNLYCGWDFFPFEINHYIYNKSVPEKWRWVFLNAYELFSKRREKKIARIFTSRVRSCHAIIWRRNFRPIKLEILLWITAD